MDPFRSLLCRVPPGDKTFSTFQKGGLPTQNLKPLSNYLYGTPPPRFGTNHPYYTAVFGINIFVLFGKKRNILEFTLLHHVTWELLKKSVLPLEIPFWVFFLQKTLGFFQILIKIHDFWIYNTTSCFIRFGQKVNFTAWNPIVSFFLKMK